MPTGVAVVSLGEQAGSETGTKMGGWKCAIGKTLGEGRVREPRRITMEEMSNSQERRGLDSKTSERTRCSDCWHDARKRGAGRCGWDFMASRPVCLVVRSEGRQTYGLSRLHDLFH